MPQHKSPFTIRRADDRGKTELRWLDSRHSFSFGRYYDPSNLGYRSLRVINDDVIHPNSGFGEHGHDDMEILTWVLAGTLRHRDSTGSDGELRPGELQAMTAGCGIRHSEVNDSLTESVHLLQIWIEPNEHRLPPSYGQKSFPAEGRRAKWQVLASPDGREESMAVHQDALLFVADLNRGESVTATLAANRYGYLHVASGAVRIDEESLTAGDAITFAQGANLPISADDTSQLLYFDLA